MSSPELTKDQLQKLSDAQFLLTKAVEDIREMGVRVQVGHTVEGGYDAWTEWNDFDGESSVHFWLSEEPDTRRC